MTPLDLHPGRGLSISSRADAQQLGAAHRRYAVAHDAALRDELVAAYGALVRATAKRFEGRGVPLEDLQQTAFVGLLEALDRFDPTRGAAFVSYAVPTMLGHLKRHFRDCRWRVHVSRAVQDRYLEIRSTRDVLTQELRRVPSPPDVAAAVGLDVEQVVEAIGAGDTFACREA
jgi:RNA polymerase sigma-B factor